MPLVTLIDRLAGLRDSRSRPRRRAAAGARRRSSGRCRAARAARPRRGSPRRPMWPFESANTDSDWARTSRSSCGLAHRPRLDRERRRPIMRSVEQLGQIVDDDVGAVLARAASAWPTRSTPDHEAEAARAPGLDPGERVLEHRRLAPARRRAPRRRRGRCRAPACPRRRLALGDHAVDRAPRRGRSMPAAASTSRQLALEETTARRKPASRAASHVARPSPRRPRRPARRSARARARSCGCRARAIVSASGGSSGRPPAARSRATPGTSARRRRAACRRRTRRSRATGSNGTNGSPLALGPRAQVLVEHLLPRRRVDLRVCVSTPSRSNRHARISSGSPSARSTRDAGRAGPRHAVLTQRAAREDLRQPGDDGRGTRRTQRRFLAELVDADHDGEPRCARRLDPRAGRLERRGVIGCDPELRRMPQERVRFGLRTETIRDHGVPVDGALDERREPCPLQDPGRVRARGHDRRVDAGVEHGPRGTWSEPS